MKTLPDDPVSVLATGIDSLVVTAQILWTDRRFFEILAELKLAAKATDKDQPGIVRFPHYEDESWTYTVRPVGASGYEWLIVSRMMTIKLGQWMQPIGRPSAVVEFRSESLWHLGVVGCVERFRVCIEAAGGQVQDIQLSRLDPCTDVLVPAELWKMDLESHMITRAHTDGMYRYRRKMTGIKVGSGAVSARLYDKPLEIETQSHKDWMWDIWGLESIDTDHRIIRIEYQLRRDALKQYGLDAVDDLDRKLISLWKSLTQGWLRFVEDASLHHTQQTVSPWWLEVQNAVVAVQDCEPLVRERSQHYDIKRSASQLRGYVTSLVSLLRGSSLVNKGEVLSLDREFVRIKQYLRNDGWTDEQFTDDVKRKNASQRRILGPAKNDSGQFDPGGLSLLSQPHSGEPT